MLAWNLRFSRSSGVAEGTPHNERSISSASRIGKGLADWFRTRLLSYSSPRAVAWEIEGSEGTFNKNGRLSSQLPVK